MNTYIVTFDLDKYRGLNFKSHEETIKYHSAWIKRRNGEDITSMPDISAIISKHGAAGKRWQSLAVADAANLGPGMLALKPQSAAILQDILTGRGVFFRILPEELGYIGFFVTNTVEALDRQRSELKLFNSSGVISKIIKYQLYPEKVRGQSIFYLKDVFPEIFVTDEFVRRVEQSGIAGFKFEHIWSDPD